MLCRFANEFPDFVAGFLQRGRSLQRRFREETITDIMMSNLILLGGPMVIVEFPDERITGADMEWNFVNPNGPAFFRIMLQAKQTYGDGKIWKRHSYRELFHKSGTGSQLQAEILCGNARKSKVATYPLYIFYHPAETCRLAQESGAHAVLGVNLMDAFIVEALAKSAGPRSPYNSLGVIQSHLFSLSDLFCPESILKLGPMAYSRSMMVYIGHDGMGIPVPPSPSSIRRKLVLQSERRLSTGKRPFEEVVRPSIVPEISKEIPAEVQSLIARTRRGDVGVDKGRLDRWRVTFVSPRVSAAVPEQF